MPYMPPFVVPKYPPVYRQGMRPAAGSIHRTPYGSDDDLDLAAGAPTATMIEQFAPSVAKVIAGLTPEEQVEVLNAKIINLRKYTGIPVVGLLAQDKILEYSARLKALEKMSRAAALQRNITLVGLTMGTLVLASMAFYYFSRARREIQETR